MGVEVLREHLQRQADARLRAGHSSMRRTRAGRSGRSAGERASTSSGRRASCATPFVSLLSDNGMAIEAISPLVGHSSSNVTETVYCHQTRPVITVGAEAMDKIFANEH